MDFGGSGGNGDTGGEDVTWSSWSGVDATPLRHGIDTTADVIRASLGLAHVSATMARRRRAVEHLRLAAEYVELRAGDRHNDPRCSRVQSALAGPVRGACVQCGCNFCVVPVVVERETDPKAVGAGRPNGTVRCGCCGERVQAATAAAPPPAATRGQGWKPWDQGYNM